MFNVGLIRSEAQEFGGNPIQAVVAHHLEDNVDQHSPDVEGSHQSQASPEFFGCCGGLIVGPGAGSVGHRLIATSATLAKTLEVVQQSSPRFISAQVVSSVASLFSTSSSRLRWRYDAASAAGSAALVAWVEPSDKCALPPTGHARWPHLA